MPQGAPQALDQRLLKRQRPAHLGLSVGHPIGSIGSIGPFVQTSDGHAGFVSLAFAIAPQGARLSDYLHQPGPRDVELLTGSTRVAKLAKIAAAQLNKQNDTDCAMAILEEPGAGNVIPAGFPDAGRTIAGMVAPEELAPGDAVAFLGRTSGFSEGTVTATVTDFEVHDQGADYRFRICIEVAGANGRSFCLPGDGGALVFRRADAKAVGLVFVGPGPDDDPTKSYVLPLGPVLDALQAQLT